jgi:hypothetical protein
MRARSPWLGLVPALVAVAGGSCTLPAPPTVRATIATDIPAATLVHIRVRQMQSWNPPVAGTTDLTFDLGSSTAQEMLPQSIGLEPTTANPAIAVIDTSDSGGGILDDHLNPPIIRRVVRMSYMPHSGQLLVFLHHACLNMVTPATGPQCPGSMTSCTVSQWCEAQGLTCGNDGCCRPYDVTADEIVPGDGGVDVTPATPDGGANCGPSMPDGGSDAGGDAAHDAAPDAPADALADAPHG